VEFLGEAAENPKEALQSRLSKHWQEAADPEFLSLIDNGTWELVELPEGRKPVGCKWVFRTKFRSDGTVERYKVRLVAKGYTQKYGEDYDETFAPVVRYSSVRTLLLAFAVQEGMVVYQMDVVTTFLNGVLDEEIYMVQPPGYAKDDEEHLVCKLKRSLYGLNQSPQCWNTLFTAFMESANFEQSNVDPCLFIHSKGADLAIIAVYVDDLIILAKSQEVMSK